MSDDERAIRELVDTWMSASLAGDTEKVLTLMADDAVFQVVGQEPFGKEAFRERAKAGPAQKSDVKFEAENRIVELKVLPGGWAYMRNHVRVAITPKGGAPMTRAGYTLTVLRKEPDGRWVLARDANLLAPV